MPISANAPSSSRRAPKKRHPALTGTPRGVFNAEAVGKVPGYPPTAEAYEARKAHLKYHREAARQAGRLHRRGIPNGFAGRRKEVEEQQAAAQRQGQSIAAALGSTGDAEDGFRSLEDRLWDHPVSSPEWEVIAAEIGIAYLIGLVCDPTRTTRTRRKAAGIVLPYLLPLPRRLSGMVRDGGIEFLRALAARLEGEGLPGRSD